MFDRRGGYLCVPLKHVAAEETPLNAIAIVMLLKPTTLSVLSSKDLVWSSSLTGSPFTWQDRLHPYKRDTWPFVAQCI